MKRFILILLILMGVIVILIVSVINFNSRSYFKFYYARQYSSGIDCELREILIDKKRERVERRLLEEYFLGPLSYKLRLDIPPEVKILDFYIVNLPKSTEAVINLNSEFLNAVEKIDEATIKALLETLKVNTKIKKVLFLSDGKRIRENIGKYNLSKFIDLK